MRQATKNVETSPYNPRIPRAAYAQNALRAGMTWNKEKYLIIIFTHLCLKSNGLFNHRSIFNFRGVWIYFILTIFFTAVPMFSEKKGNSSEMLCFAESYLGQHSLSKYLSGMLKINVLS